MLGEAGKIATWCKGKGKAVAPGLYTVQHPEYLEKIFETLKTITDVKELFILLATPEGEANVLPCPNCGGVMTEPRPFNLMFKTIVGPVEDPSNVAYLSPETAQAIFADFSNVMVSSRQMPPFGIGQVGKSFRNEVTPRNYIFRSREFEQMEVEFFIKPDEAIELLYGHVAPLTETTDLSEPQADWGWECWHKYWVEQRKIWLVKNGLPEDSFVEYWQKPDELAHYARACVDIEYRFPFGVQELEGIAARSDFDLSRHQEHSGKSMEVFDEPLKLAVKKLSDEEKDLIRKQTADYHRYYDIINRGDLYRLVLPTDNYNGKIGKCASWMYVSEDKSEALFTFVVIRTSVHPVYFVKLRGLDPKAVYVDQTNGKEYYGSTLMNAGLNLTKNYRDGDSVVIHLVRK
jgi:hypothetical protein